MHLVESPRSAEACSTESEISSLSKPIKNTWFRRCLTVASVTLLRPFVRRSGPVLLLSPWICVKIGNYRGFTEAHTLQYMGQHTSIPIPRVYCTFQRKGRTYLVMERIRGEPLTMAWAGLSTHARSNVLHQLKTMVEEMRRMPAQNDQIASIDGGSLWDCRLRSGARRFGPFNSTLEFHHYIRNGIASAPPGHPEIDEMISLQEQDWGAPVLTHGDLSSLNVLVRNGRIVGIVDWETAGWYPPYWEYTSASQVNPRNQFWEQHIDKFLEPWPRALDMEKTRQTWWGVI